jgi:hypothetical protein
MLSHLKVKVHTLSHEMTYIRRQEEKWKTRARRARERQRFLSDPVLVDTATQQSLYAEANFWSQRRHRYGLKDEARTTHLAYGSMRGRSYAKMENICYGPLKGMGGSEPDWAAIESTVERFSTGEFQPKQDYMQKFAEWLADAKVWYAGNKERIKQIGIATATIRLRNSEDPDYQRMLADRKQAAIAANKST